MKSDDVQKKKEQLPESDDREQLLGIMGLGDHSVRKSYYPELQKKITELEYEKNRYKRIFSEALNGIFQAKYDGKIIVANPAMVKLCGYPSMEQLLAISDIGTQLFAKPKEKERLIQHIFEKKSLIGFETTFKKCDGTIIDVSLNASVRTFSEQTYLECFVQDITERKMAEAELLKKEFIIRSASAPIATADLAGKLTYANPVFLETWLFEKKEDVVGRIWSDFLMKDDNSEEMINALTGESQKWRGEVKAIKKNGDLFNVLISAAAVIDDKGNPVALMATFIDVTEKRRMEEVMIQSEKMLSVGGLAAGMAHEINNPLGGMIQTAEVINNRLNDVKMKANKHVAEELGVSMDTIQTFMEKRGILKMLTTIRESGERISNIVSNMLSFARKGDLCVSTHDLAGLLDKTLELAATEYDLKKHYDFKNIEIVREYGDNLPLIVCEAGKIQQVLLNILRNGAQALQEAGEEHPKLTVKIYYEETRNMLVTEIEDNGPGMTEAVRKRIFEPFYTTKPKSIGTGLGLSVSYFIITENHGGELLVDSAVGRGTKFIIRLPVEKPGH